MNTEVTKKDEKKKLPAPVVAGVSATGGFGRADRNLGSDRSSFRKKNTRRTGREPRARQEFDQKLLNIRRVARVAAGGRRFNFSVAMILGNRKGSVGVGTGKGIDTALAIEKAMRSAKKNMIQVRTTLSQSISHRVEAKYSSARIMIMPAPGRGVVAGSATRSILELAGVKDVTAKIFSPSKNLLNIARATIEALSKLSASHTALHSKDTKMVQNQPSSNKA